MSERSEQIQSRDGRRTAACPRTESRSLDSDSLVPRIKSSVDKYLLKDDKTASDQSIAAFIDELQADDLCLIVAAKGDGKCLE